MKRIISLCIVVVLLIAMCTVPAHAATQKQEILFADVGWDSVKLNNAIAGLIAESVFGYTWTEIPASMKRCSTRRWMSSWRNGPTTSQPIRQI